MLASTGSLLNAFARTDERNDSRISAWSIPADRRLKFRFPLHLVVRFCIRYETSAFTGHGRAVNMSSGGILIAPDHAREIGVGAKVEISIEWPFLLDENIPLQLFAAGRVLRRGASDFAVAFDRHEFRTRPRSNLAEWPSGNASVRIERGPVPGEGRPSKNGWMA